MTDHRLITRAEWGAKPPKWTNDLDPTLVVRFSVHHGGNPNLNHQPGAQQMVELQNDYLGQAKFADFPYNFAIDEAGLVYEGRGVIHEGGASVGAWNAQCCSVCFLGDYTQTDMHITSEQLDAARWLRSTIFLKRYPTATAVDGHKDEYNTACPSPQIYAHLADIAQPWNPPVDPAQQPPVPETTYQESDVKTALVPLNHVGYGLYRGTYDPALGRDPIIVGAVHHGPFPDVDGWWLDQSIEAIGAQVRAGKVELTARVRPDNTAPALTHAFVSVA